MNGSTIYCLPRPKLHSPFFLSFSVCLMTLFLFLQNYIQKLSRSGPSPTVSPSGYHMES